MLKVRATLNFVFMWNVLQSLVDAGPWWSSGQCACLRFRRSKFKSRRRLNFHLEKLIKLAAKDVDWILRKGEATRSIIFVEADTSRSRRSVTGRVVSWPCNGNQGDTPTGFLCVRPCNAALNCRPTGSARVRRIISRSIISKLSDSPLNKIKIHLSLW